MSGVNIANVTYQYQKNLLFSNVNLEILKNKMTCFVGPNGSGKSTLLKIAGGLLKPSNGVVMLDEICIDAYPKKSLAKKLAYLPQQAQLPASLTVKEYLALARYCHQSWFSKLHDLDHAAIKQAITLTNLQDLSEKPVQTLSAGQQQRVRIAFMLVQQSQYLLLDEPMTGLDLKQQQDLLQLLVNLKNIYGKTIVIILHDLSQVMAIADVVVLIKEGRIAGQGSPEAMITPDYLLKIFNYAGSVSSIINPVLSNRMSC